MDDPPGFDWEDWDDQGVTIFICLSMVINLGLDVIRWDWIMTLVSNE
jgi:hypothetical protein